MSLTMGTGPFGHAPAGSFNFETPDKGAILLDVIPRRVRGLKDGETVVDSRRVHMLHESRIPPGLVLPGGRRAHGPAARDGHTTHCPWKGDTRYYARRRRREGGLDLPEPLAGMERPAGPVAFHFDALDEWLEEDEPVIGHPRDPFHRIDVNRSSRHVKVTLDGETLAESDRPLALFETGLPTRWYLPREDVDMDLLQPSETRTTCAYKGHASTFSSGGTRTSPGPTPSPPGGRADPRPDRLLQRVRGPRARRRAPGTAVQPVLAAELNS